MKPWHLLLLASLAATVQGRSLLEPQEIAVDVSGHTAPQLNATRYEIQEDPPVKVVYTSSSDEVAAPEVTIPSLGSVRGTVTRSSQLKRPIFSYLGVPFAEAPVGNLRFVAPVPKKPWEGVLDASVPGNICMQVDEASVLNRRRRSAELLAAESLTQSEDCLILDIHTPKVDPSAKLPVLVFVHGGSFMTGYSGLKGPQGLLDDDIILVSPQYRLGPLGYLNLQIDDVPGNAGLLDVVEALRWVKKNIEHFGGDPDKVTLGGHSAGAATASLLYLSPLTKGLIRGVFPMSGSALSFWSFDRNPTIASNVIALGANCGGPLTEASKRVDCLRKIPADELIKVFALYAVASLVGGNLGMSGSLPSVQRAGIKVLPDLPENILSSPNFTPLPYMTGITKHEGTFPLQLAETGYLSPNKLQQNASFVRNDMIHVLLKVIGIDDPAGFVADSSLEAFMDLSTLGDYSAMKDGIIDFFSSVAFKSPARQIALRNSGLGQPTYIYAFNHNGVSTQNSPQGIYHGADQPYVFPDGTTMSSDDLQLGHIMQRLVANFVIYQNPTPDSAPIAHTPTWPSFERDSEHYLELVWPPSTRQWFRTQFNVARRDGFSEGGRTSTLQPSQVTTTNQKSNDIGGSAGSVLPSVLLSAVALVASLYAAL